MTFTAIDFELATAAYTSVCAVGIVKVEDGVITKQYHSLVRPPKNEYMWQTTRVHGLKPKDTVLAPTFLELFPQIKEYLIGAKMVAHNEKFDREVLMKTMGFYALDYKKLGLPSLWECTSKIYRAKGFKKTKLSICCNIMGIELNHHDPLSDAKASAQLFMNQDKVTKDLVEMHFPIEGQVAS
ncbi:DNA polymerase III subunit epsilon [Sphingobacterium shayense]|uniref:exonuclease domain-containing protein n=1 Tax=Sphingobacterium shayense TaxID=626343 RepID=UPI00155720C0|nr:exonuclease domain-containing protein [Sphingobacterium shayense]NQD71847.1 DNA polymerase III subunit epsilon [Sphingobacterium shayense]